MSERGWPRSIRPSARALPPAEGLRYAASFRHSVFPHVGHRSERFWYIHRHVCRPKPDGRRRRECLDTSAQKFRQARCNGRGSSVSGPELRPFLTSLRCFNVTPLLFDLTPRSFYKLPQVSPFDWITVSQSPKTRAPPRSHSPLSQWPGNADAGIASPLRSLLRAAYTESNRFRRPSAISWPGLHRDVILQLRSTIRIVICRNETLKRTMGLPT